MSESAHPLDAKGDLVVINSQGVPDATMSVNEAGHVVITPRRSEFESLRRTLYNALDKLDRLERRVLTST